MQLSEVLKMLIRALVIFLIIAAGLVLISLAFYPNGNAEMAEEEARAQEKAQVRRTLILVGREGGSYWCKLYDKHPLFERYRLSEAYNFGGTFTTAHSTISYAFAYSIVNGVITVGEVSVHLVETWVVGVANLLLASIFLSAGWYHLMKKRRG